MVIFKDLATVSSAYMHMRVGRENWGGAGGEHRTVANVILRGTASQVCDSDCVDSGACARHGATVVCSGTEIKGVVEKTATFILC